MVQEFIHVATPEENSFIEACHSFVKRAVLQPRQFENIQIAIETLNQWKLFYNNRRLHRRQGNIAPKQQWNKWLLQSNKEPLLIIKIHTLSTNGERKSLNMADSRLVDKIFNNQ